MPIQTKRRNFFKGTQFQDKYDPKLTLLQNYRKQGLLAQINPQNTFKATDTVVIETEFRALDSVAPKCVLAEDVSVGYMLEKRAQCIGQNMTTKAMVETPIHGVITALPVIPKRRIASEQQNIVMAKLVQKYGDDIQAMAHDNKLNEYQLSASKLKKLHKLYTQSK